jgi:hypothetical protein
VDELEAIYRSLAGAGRDATVMATA